MDQPFPLAADCIKCLRRVNERNCIVHGYGDAHATVMFVGTMPDSVGANQTGVPWTRSVAGQRLQVLLRALRLRTASDPEHEQPRLVNAYMTYVVRCATHNDVQPSEQEVANCMAYLWRELMLIKPRIIVTIGELPTRLICAKLLQMVPEPVAQIHGHIFPVDDRRVVVPMIDLDHLTKDEAHNVARVLSALIDG